MAEQKGAPEVDAQALLNAVTACLAQRQQRSQPGSPRRRRAVAETMAGMDAILKTVTYDDTQPPLQEVQVTLMLPAGMTDRDLLAFVGQRVRIGEVETVV